MAASDPWLLLLCILGLLVALGATFGVVNEQLWVSEPLTCVVAGVAVGPLGEGLLHLIPATSPVDAVILREAARVTLTIGVTGAAMRSPALGCLLLGAAIAPTDPVLHSPTLSGASVLAHAISATPMTRIFGARRAAAS